MASGTATHGFDTAAFDRVVGDAPIFEVFRALAGYYATLAREVAWVQEVKDERFGVEPGRWIKLTPEQRKQTTAKATVNRRLAKQFPLKECELARDACRAVCMLLSESNEYNEGQCRRLIADLQASIAKTAKPGDSEPSPIEPPADPTYDEEETMPAEQAQRVAASLDGSGEPQ